MERSAPANLSSRYVFVDALRGIAAFAVLFHHLVSTTQMAVPLLRILPKIVIVLSEYGAFGVQVFFVLSGFVIAHSLRDNPLSLQSLGNFILRRQIRLDPVYWFMIVIALVLHRLEIAIPGLATSPMPKLSEIALNFFYLQDVARVERVVGVAWTLCLEIQFYLVFIALLCLGKMLSKSVGKLDENRGCVTLIFLSGSLSLAAIHFQFYGGWFIQYWFYFCAGVLCNWSLRKVTTQWVFLTFLALIALNIIAAFVTHIVERNISGPGMIIGLLTALAIYIVGIKGHLTDWWNNSLLQYFGRISYSLYLVHLTALLIIMRIGYKITGENERMAVFWLVIAGLISIACGHALYLTIERPSMRLASRLKREG